jgi:hypothetical protein
LDTGLTGFGTCCYEMLPQALWCVNYMGKERKFLTLIGIWGWSLKG